MVYDARPWLQAYDEGVPADLEIPKISLLDGLADVEARFGDRPALHFMGVTWSYRELMTRARRFGAWLAEKGCGTGDVVGVNLPNVPQFLVAQLGAWSVGCAVTGLSPLLTAKEMAHQLTDSGAKVLVTLDAIFEHRLAGIADELEGLETVVVTGVADELPWLKRTLGRLLKKVPTGKVTPLRRQQVLRFAETQTARAAPPPVEVGPETVALLQYTGGTTGVPKGAVLTHANLVSNLTQIRGWLQTAPGDEVLLSGFPFFHLAGLALGLVSLWLGGSQVLIPNPRDTGRIVKEIATYRPTILTNVPSLYQMLLETPGFRDLDFSRLAFAVSGAAPFPAEAIRALERAIGVGKVVEVYGMTETSPLLTANPRNGEKRCGTVGLPLPNTRLRLVDLEGGRTQVPQGEPGQIVAQGPQVMRGYWNRPDETENALRELDGERWLYTGDVAQMDEDGYLTIVDRAKDMIIVGGFKVFSREVEDKLHTHPAIAVCAMVGLPNPDRPGSELVKLVVQPTPDHADRPHDALREELLAWCREQLSPYKVPKIIDFVDEIPLTAVGKVDKKALR